MISTCNATTDTACEACEPGRFRNESGLFETCTACPNDSYSSGSGALSCLPCQPCNVGQKAVAQSCTSTSDTACVDCEPGRYRDTTGIFTECLACSEGSLAPDFGLVSCVACQPCNVGQRVQRLCNSTADTLCRACEAGRFRNTSGLYSECTPCPEGHFCEAGAVLPTACAVGTYLNDVQMDAVLAEDTETDRSVFAALCQRCVSGTKCSEVGQFLRGIELEQGYYRTRAESPLVRICAHEAACAGGDSTGDDSCEEGHHGPYCSLCEDGFYFDSSSDRCRSCASGAAIWAAAGSLFVLVIVVAVLAWYLFWHGPTEEQRRQGVAVDGGDNRMSFGTEVSRKLQRGSSVAKRTSRQMGVAVAFAGAVATAAGSSDEGASGISTLAHAMRSLTTKMRITLSFLQVQALLPLSFSIVFPDVFRAFLSLFDVLNFRIFVGVSGDCVADLNYYSGLLVTTIGPIILVALLRAARSSLSLIIAFRSSAKAMKLMQEKFDYLTLMLIFLVLPGATTTTVLTFLCEKLDTGGDPGLDEDDKEYLVQDYSVECNTPEHHAFRVYAAAMIILYPVGVPLLFAWLLVLRRSPKTKATFGQIIGMATAARVAADGMHFGAGNSMDDVITWLNSDAYLVGLGRLRDANLGSLRDAPVGEEDEDEKEDDDKDDEQEDGERPSISIESFEDHVKHCIEYLGTLKQRALQWSGMRCSEEQLQQELDPEEVHRQASSLSFLVEAYDPRFFWFEIFECYRRLALTGLPIIFQNGKAKPVRLERQNAITRPTHPLSASNTTGTVGQLAFGMLLSNAFLLVYAVFEPFVDIGDSHLAILAQAVIFGLLVYGMSQLASTAADSTSSNYQRTQEAIGGVMVFVNVVILLACCVGVIKVVSAVLLTVKKESRRFSVRRRSARSQEYNAVRSRDPSPVPIPAPPVAQESMTPEARIEQRRKYVVSLRKSKLQQGREVELGRKWQGVDTEDYL